MEKYIHRENLTLFKKRIAESHSKAEREVLLKLLAEEEAKKPPQKNGISSRAELHQGTAAQEALNTRSCLALYGARTAAPKTCPVRNFASTSLASRAGMPSSRSGCRPEGQF